MPLWWLYDSFYFNISSLCFVLGVRNFMRIVGYNGFVYLAFILLFISDILHGCDFLFFVLTIRVSFEYECQMCTATPKSMCLISISFVILILHTAETATATTKKQQKNICVKYTRSPLKHSVHQLRWIRPLQWNNFFPEKWCANEYEETSCDERKIK